MGTLTMALAAALVAGSGPEKVSGEMRQRLDLSGEWKGEVRVSRDHAFPVSLRGGQLTGSRLGKEGRRFVVTDQGSGNFLVTGHDEYLGIYKWEQDRLILCFGYERPSSFQSSDVQALLTLRRVRPRK
jgi:hypothetical protein